VATPFDATRGALVKALEPLAKFNTSHDERGRFSSGGDGGGSGGYDNFKLAQAKAGTPTGPFDQFGHEAMPSEYRDLVENNTPTATLPTGLRESNGPMAGDPTAAHSVAVYHGNGQTVAVPLGEAENSAPWVYPGNFSPEDIRDDYVQSQS